MKKFFYRTEAESPMLVMGEVQNSAYPSLGLNGSADSKVVDEILDSKW